MLDTEFYQGHLDRVSRSFAFCIPKLDPPFRQWLSLSYLLCRALDTIEDSAWSGRILQNAQYRAFNEFMRRRPVAAEVMRWSALFPADIPAGERRLLEDIQVLFDQLHDLPSEPRRAIQSCVSVMRQGMQHYSEGSRQGVLRLTDLSEVNRYCYIVAGVVGQLASELFLIHRPDFRPSAEFGKNALHLGFFLQKINILKDQKTDQEQGRHFIPDREALLSSLRAHAEGGLNYLTELPANEKGYRTFCGWSLFLGAASLSGARIPRARTQQLLGEVEAMILFNSEIRENFDAYSDFMPEMAAPQKVRFGSAEPAWFRDLAGQKLDALSLTEPGLAS